MRGGVWILRMKFIGALGLDSEREKRPEVEVAEGGNGCWVFAAFRAFAGGGTEAGGKSGMFGCETVACIKSETSCWCGKELKYLRF